jgi:phosphoribosylglycinamide formyltransferase 1
MRNIAIFASGAGSNAKKIIEYFSNHPSINVRLLVSNKPEAGALTIAANARIETMIIQRERFIGDGYLPELQERNIDFIVLAGFLWKIPSTLVNAYPRAIINIHPALLPLFGGKGMYGAAVHNAVIRSGASESGITIHWVDEQYDHGDTILQVKCPVYPDDTADSLAERIHRLEHLHFAPVIEKLLTAKS